MNAESPVPRPHSPVLMPIAAAFLALLVVLGSAFLWIGIPVLGFWLVGELTTTPQGFLLIALGGIPTAMVGFGWLLYRLNGLYETTRGGEPVAPSPRAAWLRSFSDERAGARRARAPRRLIDVAMTVSAVAAMVFFAIWFLFEPTRLGPMQ